MMLICQLQLCGGVRHLKFLWNTASNSKASHGSAPVLAALIIVAGLFVFGKKAPQVKTAAKPAKLYFSQ